MNALIQGKTAAGIPLIIRVDDDGKLIVAIDPASDPGFTNVLYNGATPATNAGNVDGATLRVVLPFDQAPIATYPRKAYAAPNNATVGTAAGDVFTVGFSQIGFIQNLGTNPLFVRYATGAATNAFHVVLYPGSTNDDGKGEKLFIEQLTGTVSVAGTSPRFIAWTAQQ